MAIIKHCPECGCKLWHDYFNPDYFNKTYNRERAISNRPILLNQHGWFCVRCGYAKIDTTEFLRKETIQDFAVFADALKAIYQNQSIRTKRTTDA